MNSPRGDSMGNSKRILVYRNGDSFFQAHKVVINKRACKTYDALLRDVTNTCKLPKFCRCLYTPRNGHRVKGLDDLEGDKAYVAAAGERFKKIGYSEIQDPLHKRPVRRVIREIEPVKHSNIQASARHKKIMQLSPLTIFVYLNGEFLRPAHRILLTPRVMNMHNIDAIFETVQERVVTGKGGIAKLVTLEGSPIRNAADLKNLEYYVALGKHESFINCGYGRPREPLKLSPRLDRRDQGLYARSQQNNFNFRAKRLKKGRAKKDEDDDPFHSKPVTHKRSGEAKSREVNYDNDDDIFRASNRESEKAVEVEENKDTKVDLPVDQVEAEEVKEDEGAGNDQAVNDNNDLTKQPSEAQVTDSVVEAEPVNTTGDDANDIPFDMDLTKKPSDEGVDSSKNNNALSQQNNGDTDNEKEGDKKEEDDEVRSLSHEI
uniref:Doublecortin domain-containing protein 2 n=1 Tax=Cerebratulus lacteus TaxID=6221 RepID=A0A0G2YLE4_CERLA|nr:doublecortin domain-containing protein 2 [Cerebratulus lacteus]